MTGADFVSEPPTPSASPPPSWITPEKVVFKLLAPTVKLTRDPRSFAVSLDRACRQTREVVAPCLMDRPLPESLIRAVPPSGHPLKLNGNSIVPGSGVASKGGGSRRCGGMSSVTPPPPPMTVPPFVIALLPALDVSQNAVVPPTDVSLKAAIINQSCILLWANNCGV